MFCNQINGFQGETFQKSKNTSRWLQTNFIFLKERDIMENLTAKQLEEKIGFKKNTSIFIGEFQFVIYVDYDINSRYGSGKSYIHIHQCSCFNDVIDLQKQYSSTNSLIKDLKKQLKQLSKKIEKSLSQSDSEL